MPGSARSIRRRSITSIPPRVADTATAATQPEWALKPSATGVVLCAAFLLVRTCGFIHGQPALNMREDDSGSQSAGFSSAAFSEVEESFSGIRPGLFYHGDRFSKPNIR